jgi:hypothetical protein
MFDPLSGGERKVAGHDIVEENFEETQREQIFVVAQVILTWLIRCLI